MEVIDMPAGGASWLSYLGFLEVLTRMAHAVRGGCEHRVSIV